MDRDEQFKRLIRSAGEQFNRPSDHHLSEEEILAFCRTEFEDMTVAREHIAQCASCLQVYRDASEFIALQQSGQAVSLHEIESQWKTLRRRLPVLPPTEPRKTSWFGWRWPLPSGFKPAFALILLAVILAGVGYVLLRPSPPETVEVARGPSELPVARPPVARPKEPDAPTSSFSLPAGPPPPHVKLPGGAIAPSEPPPPPAEASLPAGAADGAPGGGPRGALTDGAVRVKDIQDGQSTPRQDLTKNAREAALKALSGQRLYIAFDASHPQLRQLAESLKPRLKARGQLNPTEDRTSAQCILNLAVQETSPTDSPRIVVLASIVNTDGVVIWPSAEGTNARSYEGPQEKVLDQLSQDLLEDLNGRSSR